MTEIAPEVAEGHYQLGLVLADAGDSAGARAAYLVALEKQPDHKPAKEALEKED